MEEIYLLTGATGFLGSAVAKELIRQKKKVVGLRLPGDKAHLLPEVEYQLGDITKPYTLNNFFERAEGKQAIVTHCAGLVTIASKDHQVWNVNVDGTRNIVDLCEKHKIAKFIYVSSVHASRESEEGQIIKEEKRFSASLVKGIYGKSKAEATAYVLKAAERGLNAMVVHPSGIIGAEDIGGTLLVTPYSIYTLGSNGNFSHEKAENELGYTVRPIEETLADIVMWLQKGDYILLTSGADRKRRFYPL